MATGKPESQSHSCIPVDHGIVKATRSHFKKIRRATAKNRFCPMRGCPGRGCPGRGCPGRGCPERGCPVRASAGRVKLFAVQLPLKSPWAVALAHQLARSWRRGGCQVRHAPLVAMRCICMPVAAKRSEYEYILKNPLTGIVFVPVLSSTLQRYTTRAIEVPKIFV
jgi:hypothetical protein